jgi:hypothetical protein
MKRGTPPFPAWKIGDREGYEEEESLPPAWKTAAGRGIIGTPWVS